MIRPSEAQIEKCMYWLLILIVISNFISEVFTRNIVRILFLVVVYRLLFCRRDMQSFDWKLYKPFAFLMGTFTAVLVLSAACGGNFHYGITGGITFWYNFCNMFLVFIAGWCIRRKEQIMAIFEAALVMMLLTDGYMFLQAYSGAQRAGAAFKGAGVLVLAMMIGYFMAPLLIVLIKKRYFRTHRWFYITVFCVTVLALLFNGTRGAWLALLAVFTGIFLLYGKENKKALIWVLVSCMGIGVLTMAVPSVHQRVASIVDMQEQSHSERMLMWRSAFQMGIDHPVLGVGLGNYISQYQGRYIMPEAKEKDQRHAHDNLLQMFAENGLMGVAAFCGLFGYILCWSWQRRKSSFAAMLLAMTAVFLLHGIVDYTYGANTAMRLYWLCMGLYIQGTKFGEGDMD